MLFIELIQAAIGRRDNLTHTPSVAEWQELYALVAKHSLVGICFLGIERLPKEQHPPKALLMVCIG